MVDISEFPNLEYENNESRIIRFFHFLIYFLFLGFFNSTNTQNTYIYWIRSSWNFDTLKFFLNLLIF